MATIKRSGLDFRVLSCDDFVSKLSEDLRWAAEVLDCVDYSIEIDYTYCGTPMSRFVRVGASLEDELRAAYASLRESKNWEHGVGWSVERGVLRTSGGTVNVLFTPEAWSRIRSERARAVADVSSYYGRGGGSYCGD